MEIPEEVTDALCALVAKTQAYYWHKPNPAAPELQNERDAVVAAIAKAIAEAPDSAVRHYLKRAIDIEAQRARLSVGCLAHGPALDRLDMEKDGVMDKLDREIGSYIRDAARKREVPGRVQLEIRAAF